MASYKRYTRFKEQKPRRHRNLAYTDGVMYVGKEETKWKGSRKIGYEFVPLTKVKFSEVYKREEDVLYARQVNRKLDLKLKTYRVEELDNNALVRINGQIYDVIKTDGKDKELFVYLERRNNDGAYNTDGNR